MEICWPAGVFPFWITCWIVSWYFSGCSSLYFSSNFFGYFPLYLTRRLCGVWFSWIHKSLPYLLRFSIDFPICQIENHIGSSIYGRRSNVNSFLIFPDKTQHHRYTIKAFWLKCFSGQMFADEPSNLSVYKILILPNVWRSCLPGYSFSTCIVWQIVWCFASAGYLTQHPAFNKMIIHRTLMCDTIPF